MASLTQVKQNRHYYLSIVLAVFVVIIVGGIVGSFQKRTGNGVAPSKVITSTTLSFNTSPITSGIDQQVTDDIILDPGNKQVSTVKLLVRYDTTQFAIVTGSQGLTPNTAAFPHIVQQPSTRCNGTQCVITAVFARPVDQAKAIIMKTKVATLHARALAAGSITFAPGTAIFASNDQQGENLLFSTTPVIVTVGNSTATVTHSLSQACLESTCSWDNLATAVSYHYVVTDVTTKTVVVQGDLQAPQTSVVFPHQQGDTYSCAVSATNACKTDKTISVTSTCSVISSKNTFLASSMQRVLASSTSITPTTSVTPVPRATCNQSCSVDTDCVSGLVCSSGLCRNASCSQDSTCACSQPTNTPTVTVAPTDTPTGIPSVTLAALPSTGPGDTYAELGIVGVIVTIVGMFLLFGI